MVSLEFFSDKILPVAL